MSDPLGAPLIWALALAYVAFFVIIVGYLVVNGISLESLRVRTRARFSRLDWNARQ